jgi:cell wall-associated NlpC family hydrolase
MAFSKEQLQNAATIAQVGRSMGASTRDIQIALAAALVESGLVNVNYGDRDSLGLFQQRPSQGWGTPEQVMNPSYAAGKFFKALMGLGDRRYGMSMGQAAQAVQKSAYPDRYQQKIGEVRQLWPAIQKGAGEPVTSMDGGQYPVEQNTGQIDPTSLMTTVDASQQLTQQSGALSVGTPDAATMLGSWGMNSPQPVVPALDPAHFSDGTKTVLSQAMNTEILPPPELSQNYGQGVDGWRRAVVEAAKGALGTPYQWGGTNLQSGIDCSGLVQQAYAKAGISLPRISYQQANSGQRVGIKGLQPGDLVAWDNSPRNPGADHIAIYIGNGQIIEAPRPGLAVRIRSIGPNLDGGWGVHMNRK